MSTNTLVLILVPLVTVALVVVGFWATVKYAERCRARDYAERAAGWNLEEARMWVGTPREHATDSELLDAKVAWLNARD